MSWILLGIYNQLAVILANQEKIMSEQQQISDDLTKLTSFVSTLAPILPQVLTALQNGQPLSPAVLQQLNSVAGQADAAQAAAQNVASAVNPPAPSGPTGP